MIYAKDRGGVIMWDGVCVMTINIFKKVQT